MSPPKIAASKHVLLGIDYGRSATDALPRVLYRAGCRTTLVCPRTLLIAKTRLVDRLVICAPSKDDFLDAFCAELATGAYDWAVIGHDYQRDLLDRCDRASLDWWFSVPPGDCGKHFVFAKNDFLRTCSAANIPVPPFKLCSSAAQAQGAAEAIGYPVVVKLSSGYSGLSTFLARDEGDLGRVLNAIDVAQAFVVQRMVDGPIGSTDVLFDRGRALCRLSSYSGDCAPTPFSPKTARRIIESSALDEIVDQIGELAHYHGFAGIDWVQDAATGEFFVLEISPNPDGGYALTDDAERSFTAAIRAMLTGEPSYRPHSVKARPGWIPLFPEWSVYFTECADRTSPAMWLRFLKMLTHISCREPFIALLQLCMVLRFVAVRVIAH